MKSQIQHLSIAIIIIAAVQLVSCTKQGAVIDGSSQNNSPVEAKPFKGEVYCSLDNQNAITLISRDELELREGTTNLICKYTKQDNTLRVVANVMGSAQAFYYRATPQGLLNNQGRIFYNAEGLEAAKQAAEAARQQAAEQARKQEEERRRWREETNEVASFRLSSDSLTTLATTRVGHRYAPDKVIITDVSVKLHFPENEPNETAYFADFDYLGSVHAERIYIIDAFNFGLGWQKEQHTFMPINCLDQAEAEKVRNTLLNAFGEWSRKFPKAVPQVNFAR